MFPLDHMKIAGILINALFLFLLLTTGVVGAQAHGVVTNHHDNTDNTNSKSAPHSDWTPPLHAYRVVIAPDDSHENRELIFGALDGIYQLDYGYLKDAGLTVDSLDPHTFRMFYMGEEIAIQVEGETDGSFDQGVGALSDDAVLFYGQGVDSLFNEGEIQTNKYADANVYWLTYGDGNGKRMQVKDGTAVADDAEAYLKIERLETNRWYLSNLPKEHDVDHWYWEQFKPFGVGKSHEREFDFTINHLASGTHTGFLSISAVGELNGPHHIKTYINDHPVLDDAVSWEDTDTYLVKVDVPQDYFIEGVNTIKIEIINDVGKLFDQVSSNWIEVGYYDTFIAENNVLRFSNDQVGNVSYLVNGFSGDDIQVYDVSDFQNVEQYENVAINPSSSYYSARFGDIVGGTSRYIAVTPDNRLIPYGIEAVSRPVSVHTPVDLLDTNNKADYIVITHADFWDEAFRLATFRAQKYQVAQIDVQQIYDQFNGGMMAAEAIHDFLEYAHLNWNPPSPMFVVLLGDGTYDLRQYLGTSAPTFLPPYLYLADPGLGETASQNQFVTLTGDDILPDMHIGRLPVNSIAEAQGMVDKIIAYEVDCKCGSWNYETLFVSDDTEGGGGIFYEYSDRIANDYVPKPPYYEVNKVYLGQTCFENQDDEAIKCQTDFVDSLNTDGALFVSWVGHSSEDVWGAEHIVDIPTIDQLDNAPCLPLSVAMTCYEGSFHNPSDTGLAEHAVRMPGAGFVASWSPTGKGLAPGHDLLEEGLMLALLYDDVLEVGAAITQAKEHLYQEADPNQYDDLILTFILLGDPALQMKTDAVCSSVPTAVRLDSFGIRAQPDALHLSWRTVDEIDILGFNVLRQVHSLPDNTTGQSFEQINDQFMLAQSTGLMTGADYIFVDDSVIPGVTYAYKLEVLSLDETRAYYDLGKAYTFSSYDIPIHPVN